MLARLLFSELLTLHVLSALIKDPNLTVPYKSYLLCLISSQSFQTRALLN